MRSLNKDKKGDFTWLILMLFVGLAAALLLFGSLGKSKNTLDETTKLSCSGMGFAEGECVSTQKECSSRVGTTSIKGLSCPDNKPYCCLGGKKLAEAPEKPPEGPKSPTGNKTGTGVCTDWASSDCKVSITDIKAEIISDYAVITCGFDKENAPCVYVTQQFKRSDGTYSEKISCTWINEAEVGLSNALGIDSKSDLPKNKARFVCTKVLSDHYLFKCNIGSTAEEKTTFSLSKICGAKGEEKQIAFPE